MNLAKAQTVISRRLDWALGWISFSEFVILFTLSVAPDNKLKRIDLANKVWLTASWVTRLLWPMEKIWLVSRETNEKDARVSLVILAPGWKRKLEEAIERAEFFAEETVSPEDVGKLWEMSDLLIKIGKAIVWN